MSERQVHVVFGAGQIGAPLARMLEGRGHEVRLVRRSGGGPEGIEVRNGDAGDPAFAASAAAGASVVYHCMNPPAYDRKVWAEALPRLMDSLIAASGKAGARLVVLDNLYLLGRPGGRPLSEDSPIAPCSRKGEIRARINQRLLEAERRGDVRVVIGRASDFYGPGGVGTYFGDAFWPKALAAGEAATFVSLDTPHTYHYTLDVAAALATLGGAGDEVTGRWWMLPAAPAEPSRAMIARLGTALGRELRIRATPGPVLALAGLFVPLLRELSEMSYQWQEPFVVDDRRYRERFRPAVTALEDGARATVAWATRHYRAATREGAATS
ncbi:MAG TPA: NAD-dependent epimerase/dehydratase family protein [Candidatus Eisenbacteria bacterium]